MYRIPLSLPPINRLTLVGRVVNLPETKQVLCKSKIEPGEEYVRTMTRFMIQHYHRRFGSALRLWVYAWGEIGVWLAARAKIQQGDAVYVEGNLRQRPIMKGERRELFFWLEAERLHFVPELPRVIREGAHYMVPCEAFDRLSEALTAPEPPQMTREEFDSLMARLNAAKEAVVDRRKKDE